MDDASARDLAFLARSLRAAWALEVFTQAAQMEERPQRPGDYAGCTALTGRRASGARIWWRQPSKQPGGARTSCSSAGIGRGGWSTEHSLGTVRPEKWPGFRWQRAHQTPGVRRTCGPGPRGCTGLRPLRRGTVAMGVTTPYGLSMAKLSCIGNDTGQRLSMA